MATVILWAHKGGAGRQASQYHSTSHNLQSPCWHPGPSPLSLQNSLQLLGFPHCSSSFSSWCSIPIGLLTGLSHFLPALISPLLQKWPWPCLVSPFLPLSALDSSRRLYFLSHIYNKKCVFNHTMEQSCHQFPQQARGPYRYITE